MFNEHPFINQVIVWNKKDEKIKNLIKKNYHRSKFLKKIKPKVVIIAAARVGGIYANNKFRGKFIYENLGYPCIGISAEKPETVAFLRDEIGFLAMSVGGVCGLGKFAALGVNLHD